MKGIRSASEPYARLLANQVCQRFGTDWGLSETGATGPTGNRYGDAAGHSCMAVSSRVVPLGGLEGVTPGSSCIANAYTSNHELIASGKIGSFKSFALHVVDATGLVHAMLLRIQALLLPIKTLVLSGH